MECALRAVHNTLRATGLRFAVSCARDSNCVYSIGGVHTSRMQIHREAEKRNRFSFVNKSFNVQCNLTKFSTLIVNEYYHRCYLFNCWNLH